VMVVMPLGDTSKYWSNIRLMYESAARHGLSFEVALFPKEKYGPERCYLYATGAPQNCKLVAGSTTALAHQKLLKLMSFVQGLGGACQAGNYNSKVAVW